MEKNSRIFVGGLHENITCEDLKSRFQKYGDVSSVDIKSKKNETGEVIKTFAYMNILSTDHKLAKCMNTFNNTTWRGHKLTIQPAKESILDRFKKERLSLPEESPKKKKRKHDVIVKTDSPATKEIKLTENKPGTLVSEDEKWVVGKYGRILPIVNVRKPGGRLITMDPSKHCHQISKIKNNNNDVKDKVSEMTWVIADEDSEITKKRKGEFPIYVSKKNSSKKKVVDKTPHVEQCSVEQTKTSDVSAEESTTDIDFEIAPIQLDGAYTKLNNLTNNDSDDTDDIISSLKESRVKKLKKKKKDTICNNKVTDEDSNCLTHSDVKHQQFDDKQIELKTKMTKENNIRISEGLLESDLSNDEVNNKTNETLISTKTDVGNKNKIILESTNSHTHEDDSTRDTDTATSSTDVPDVPISKDNKSKTKKSDNKETDVPLLSKAEKKKSKTKKKNDNNEANKKEAKHNKDNEKRLLSLENKKKASQTQKMAMKQALASIDSSEKKLNKKIVFDSDSEDDNGDDIITSYGETETDDTSLKTKPTLFDSDQDEESDSFEETFRIRPEYEGKAGSKLITMQSKFHNDTRFKMDEKFLESDSEDSDAEKVGPMKDTETTDSIDLTKERQVQLDILKSIVGPIAVENKKSATSNVFHDSNKMRYDPTNEDHAVLEMHPEYNKPTKISKKAKLKMKKDIEVKEDEKPPEVSKDKFYEVSASFKDAFSKKDSVTFGFMNSFEDNIDDTKMEEDEYCTATPQQGVLSKKIEHFKVNDEDANDVSVPKEPTGAKEYSTFFFSHDDPRLLDGSKSFCRTKDKDVVRKEWEEKRQTLIDDYRQKHKRAVRKSRNTPQNRPFYQKQKH